MRKRLFNFIALAIILTMVLSITACGKVSEVTTKATSEVTTKATLPEQVTLTWWHPADSSGGGVNGIHDDPIIKEIAKQTGVTIDFINDVTPEKYNAMLAAGDLPDIMTIWNKDRANLIDGKNVIDMEPLLKEHGKSLQTETPEKLEFSKTFMSGGQNKLFFVPTWNTDINPTPIKTFSKGTGIGLYTRWDYYKEIGYPEIKNDIFDMIPILKQMQDKHPKNADGKKVYGTSPWFGDWDLWDYTVLTEGMMNVDAECEKFIDIEQKDNGYMKSQIGDTTSTLWTGAKFYNKAYQAGILDPDSLTQKFDATMEKLNAGRILFGVTSWAIVPANAFYTKNGHPEQGFMALKLPSSIPKVAVGFGLPYGDRWSYAISSKCKSPEKAMDFINYVCSSDGMRTFENGVEGVDWTVGSDNIPRWTAETKKLMASGSKEELTAKGFGIYTQMYGESEEIKDVKYNCSINFKNNEDLSTQTASSPLFQDYSTHYGVEYPDQIFEKTLNQKKDANGAFYAMADVTPSEIKQIDDSLLNYLKSGMAKSVLAKTDAEFEAIQKKVIEDCKNIGYEKAYQWHKDNYEKARNKLNAK